MGAWGYKLFENDTAEDVREDFQSLILSLDCENATQKIIDENKDTILDLDEAPDFWFALAYLQCKKKMLLETVKAEALKCIENGYGMRMWETSPHAKKRQHEIDLLKKMLLEYTCDTKAVSRKRKLPQPFVCGWHLGDTFAYRLTSEYAAEQGVFNRYLIFNKVDEEIAYPNHIDPVVTVKITPDDTLPKNKEEIDNLQYVQMSVVSEFVRMRDDTTDPLELQRIAAAKSTIVSERDEYGYIPLYRVQLLFTSKRSVPKDLIYLGNFELCPPKINYIEKNKYGIMCAIYWKFAEEFIIDNYISFNLRRAFIYGSQTNLLP